MLTVLRFVNIITRTHALSLSLSLSLSHAHPFLFILLCLLLNSLQKGSFKRNLPFERFILISLTYSTKRVLWWLWFLECISSTKIYPCCHRLKPKFPAASKAMANRASTGYLIGNTSKMLVSRVGTAAKRSDGTCCVVGSKSHTSAESRLSSAFADEDTAFRVA